MHWDVIGERHKFQDKASSSKTQASRIQAPRHVASALLHSTVGVGASVKRCGENRCDDWTIGARSRCAKRVLRGLLVGYAKASTLRCPLIFSVLDGVKIKGSR